MVYFQTKNFNLGKFLMVLQWKMLVYFMVIWSILGPFWSILWSVGIFYGNLVYLKKIWQSCKTVEMR
jgi:hypothetical protein